MDPSRSPPRRSHPVGCRLVLAGLCLAATLASPNPASAAPGDAGCRIKGWSADPRGLPVHAAPSAASRRVGRLPTFVLHGDEPYGPGFDILAARDGWLRIAAVTDSFGPADRPPRRVAGTGWVRGEWVRFAVQSATGREAPRADAPAIVTIAEDDWLAGAGEVRAVTDCQGRWARVRYRLHPTTPATGPRAGEAWFTAICPSQRTTCDGVLAR